MQVEISVQLSGRLACRQKSLGFLGRAGDTTNPLPVQDLQQLLLHCLSIPGRQHEDSTECSQDADLC